MDAFARGVAELGTFPDKGKIDVLAMLASDALGDAAAVPAFARLLLDGVYGAHPPRKLPLVYVIDAVVKMRGGAEFQAALAPEIAQCFESAYSQMSPAEQVKMQKTLATWLDLGIFPSETPRLQASIPAYVKPPPAMHAPAPGQQQMLQPGYRGAPPGPFYNGGYGGAPPHLMLPMAAPPPQQHGGMMMMPQTGAAMGMMMQPPAGVPAFASGPYAGGKRPRAVMMMEGPPGAAAAGFYEGDPSLGFRGPAGGYGGGYGQQQPHWQQQQQPPQQHWQPQTPVPHWQQQQQQAAAFYPQAGPAAAMHGPPRGVMVPPGTRVIAGPPAAVASGPPVGGAFPVLSGPQPGQPRGVGSGLARLLSRIQRPVPVPDAAQQGPEPAEADDAAAEDGAEGPTPPLFEDQAVALLPGDALHPATTDVSPATLALPDAAAVRLLLDLQPFVCGQCGARFPEEGALGAHREEHAAEAARTRGVSSRTWYAAADDWVAGARGLASHATAKTFFELQEEAEAAAAAERDADGRSVGSADSDSDALTVPAPTPDVPCSICGDPFHKRYNEASETWVYTGAAADEAGGLHHVACARALLPPPPPPSPPAPVFESDAAAV